MLESWSFTWSPAPDKFVDLGVSVANGIGQGVYFIGKGVYSFGEDMVLGGQRTFEGWGGGEDGRAAEIGYENRVIVSLIYDAVRYGLDSEKAPLYMLIARIVKEFLAVLPEGVQRYLAKKLEVAALKKGAEIAGRSFIAKPLLKAITLRAVKKVAASAAYKFLVARLGISGAATITLPVFGPLVLLVTTQGTLQRASHAAARLQAKAPGLFAILAKNDLQFLYFLVEEVLEPLVDIISSAEKLAKDGKRLETVDTQRFKGLLFEEVGNER